MLNMSHTCIYTYALKTSRAVTSLKKHHRFWQGHALVVRATATEGRRTTRNQLQTRTTIEGARFGELSIGLTALLRR